MQFRVKAKTKLMNSDMSEVDMSQQIVSFLVEKKKDKGHQRKCQAKSKYCRDKMWNLKRN